ncbi:MAG: hypothetical protein NTV00_12955 [Methylococcales bacterium]|nr:hypothetical protein [Methylococcales bacterium]
MQIYLTSHDSEATLVALVQQTLDKHALQQIKIESIPPSPAAIHKNLDPDTVVTLTTLVLHAAEIHAVTTHVAKFIETLVNRNVEVNIQHNNTTIQLSGSAGHIERILKDILK